MPLRRWKDSDGHHTEYVQPIMGQSLSVEALRRIRAQASRDRDDMLALQKSAGKADRDSARFFKEEAGHYLKTWRAADFWLLWATGSDGARCPAQWPIELVDYLDRVFSKALSALA